MEQIGEGGAAVVKKCRNKVTDTIYACKIMRNYDEEKERTSRAEFNLIWQIKPHPNIIIAVEFISTVDRTYNIMECATGIELQEYVITNKGVKSFMYEKSIMIQLISAIAHLHDQFICHKDIKPENIIINPEDLQIKLIDFNISQCF
jgi:serine/threonine protein kinase